MIQMNDNEIKEVLMQRDENFKSLQIKHQEYEQRIKVINDKDVKTDMDIVEERNLKKEKLKLKDSMQQYIFEFKKNGMP